MSQIDHCAVVIGVGDGIGSGVDGAESNDGVAEVQCAVGIANCSSVSSRQRAGLSIVAGPVSSGDAVGKESQIDYPRAASGIKESTAQAERAVGEWTVCLTGISTGGGVSEQAAVGGIKRSEIADGSAPAASAGLIDGRG